MRVIFDFLANNPIWIFPLLSVTEIIGGITIYLLLTKKETNHE